LNSYKLEFQEDELKPIPKPGELSHKKQSLEKESVSEDPLTNGNDYNDDDNDILDVIQMDVERLIIDPIFQKKDIKDDITQILYNYDKFTPYKQGFHEICGLVYLVLYQDDPTNSNIKIETFNVFTSLMLSVAPNFYNEDNLIGWCISIFNKFFKLTDSALYDFFIKIHKIESQLWLIRWVRLLFMRELGLNNTVKILDMFICYDHDLSKLIPFVIIISLIKIKLRLVECEDNGEILTLLLHYPHKEYSNEEVKELIDLSIKLYRAPESKLEEYGIALNKRFHKGMGINWEKSRDIDRLRMELRLQKKVRRMLKRK